MSFQAPPPTNLGPPGAPGMPGFLPPPGLPPPPIPPAFPAFPPPAQKQPGKTQFVIEISLAC